MNFIQKEGLSIEYLKNPNPKLKSKSSRESDDKQNSGLVFFLPH